MTLHKGKATGDLSKFRYDRDLKLIETLETKKTEERDKVVTERDTVDKAYLGMAELQALITEAKKYKDEIEEMHTEHEHLNIKIKEMADGTEYLQEKKE
jgi:hypothetical protein